MAIPRLPKKQSAKRAVKQSRTRTAPPAPRTAEDLDKEIEQQSHISEQLAKDTSRQELFEEMYGDVLPIGLQEKVDANPSMTLREFMEIISKRVLVQDMTNVFQTVPGNSPKIPEDHEMGVLRHGQEERILPKCPVTPDNHLLGDQDVKVREWWFRHHPELAHEKYRGRLAHLDVGNTKDGE